MFVLGCRCHPTPIHQASLSLITHHLHSERLSFTCLSYNTQFNSHLFRSSLCFLLCFLFHSRSPSFIIVISTMIQITSIICLGRMLLIAFGLRISVPTFMADCSVQVNFCSERWSCSVVLMTLLWGGPYYVQTIN